jgi:hypothetical protein
MRPGRCSGVAEIRRLADGVLVAMATIDKQGPGYATVLIFGDRYGSDIESAFSAQGIEVKLR